MKKVITMVGTSIFENYLKKEEDMEFYTHMKEVRDKKSDEYEEEKDRIKIMKNKINKWIEKNPAQALEMCAEIKSIKKISEEVGDLLEVYFLTSDTILSNVSFELITENWEKFEGIKNFNFHPCEFSKAVIKGLQVKDKKKFLEGMKNLINKLSEISNYYWESIIINITAGYKATVPYLTILAQINKCPIYYIFEETDALIKIPNLPISLDWELFEKYWKKFEMLYQGKILKKNEIPYCFLKESSPLLEEVKINNHWFVSLNPLGEILYQKYQNQFFIFYTTEKVYKDIERQKGIQYILKNKFWNINKRNNKTENKNGHRVYDDGRNPFRIFYFEDEGKIYIYKTFEEHESDYEDYLRNQKFSEEFKKQFIENAKPYKVKKEENNV